MSVPRCLTDASKSLSLFCMQTFLSFAGCRIKLCALTAAISILISSTYSIRSMAGCLPICSYKVPPKSFVILYFPSEKHLPCQTTHKEQLLQEIQLFILLHFPSYSIDHIFYHQNHLQKAPVLPQNTALYFLPSIGHFL